VSGANIAQIIGLILALILAARALRSRRMDARRTGLMAAAWIVIIVALTLVLTLLDRG
jgi:uncharacterized membrane protein YecN with MAPEG domain